MKKVLFIFVCFFFNNVNVEAASIEKEIVTDFIMHFLMILTPFIIIYLEYKRRNREFRRLSFKK